MARLYRCRSLVLLILLYCTCNRATELHHRATNTQKLAVGFVRCSHEGPVYFQPNSWMDATIRHLHVHGHSLREIPIAELQLDADWPAGEEVTPQLQRLADTQLLLACGESGHAVYDYSERLAIPYVKFTASGDPSWQHAPVFEWPGLIVGGNRSAVPACFAGVAHLPEPTSQEAMQQLGDRLAQLAAAGKPPEQCGASLQDAVAPPLPPLGLSMIVKDEAHSITKTLASLQPFVDAWAILDTGSTDATRQLITAALAGVPGQLAHAPFKDFATTRNAALRLLRGRAAWLLVVDGDTTVRGAWRLQRAAARLAKACAVVSYPVCGAAMGLMWDMGGSVAFDSLRAWSSAGAGTASGWRFIYPVHELATNEPAGTRQQLLYRHTSLVRLLAEARSHNKSAARMEAFDLPVLDKARRRRPADTRLAFYYAQTLGVLGRHEAAEAAYRARIAMPGGYRPETYVAMVRLAKVLKRQGKDPTEAALAAEAYEPSRAEALHELADWHHQQTQAVACKADPLCAGRHNLLAWLYARGAAAKRRDQVSDTLFIEEAVYSHKAARLQAYHAVAVAELLGDVAGEGRAVAGGLAARFPQDSRYSAMLAAFAAVAAGGGSRY